jgi:hypothetical protein
LPDNNLGAKINFCFEEKDIINIYLQRISIVFQAKDDAALKASQTQTMSLSQNGNCYYRSDFRLGPAN